MRPWALAALILAAAAPAVADVAPGAPPSGAMVANEWAKLNHALPKSVWRVESDGALVHLESGLVCPVTLAGYRRMPPTTYDGLGLDISCDYLAEGKHITLYLTLNHGAPLDALLSQAQSDLLQVGPAFHPVLLSRPAVRQGALDWLTARYAEDGARRSDIWFADLYGWTFEFRATYDAAREAEVAGDIAAMTARVQASAGVRLRRCTVSRAPLRDGVALHGGKAAQDMGLTSAILAAGAQAAVAEGKGTPAGELAWCVEDVVRGQSRPMLLWRAVGDDGADAKEDRLTLATDELPPTLLSAGDDLGALIDKNAADRWTVSLTDGDRTRIFAYFNGRPSAAVLAPLFADILAGKARALAGYGVDGKTITIETPDKP